MKKLVPISLLILGAIEVFYGVLWGGLQIYAHEAPFAQALHLQDASTEQVHAYNHYIRLFKDQWHVVALFGILTIVGAIVSLRVESKKT